MPEIRQYQSQVNPAGPTNVQRASAEDFGAGIGQAQQQLGDTLGDVGDVVQQRIVQDELVTLDTKIAQAQDRLGLQMKDEIQKGTLDHDKFMDHVQDELDFLGEEASTPQGQRKLQELSSRTKLHFSLDAQKGQAELAGDRAALGVKVGMDARSSYVMANPNRFTQALEEQNSAIDDMVATQMLPASEGLKLKKMAMDQFAVGALRGVMKVDPAQAEKELSSGAWDVYLGADTKNAVEKEIHAQKRAMLEDQERAERLKEKAKKLVIEKTSVEFLGKMHTDEGLTSTDVLDAMRDGKIDASTAEHFWKALEQENQDKKVRSDPAVLRELSRRIVSTGPDRIGDPAYEINRHIGLEKGGISIPDAMSLYSLAQQKKTLTGEADSALHKAYFEMGFSSIAKPDPLTKIPTAENAQLHLAWLSKNLADYNAGIANGKTPAQLLTPGSPDYLGDKNPVTAFQLTMDQQIDSLINSKRGYKPPPPPGHTEMILPGGSRKFIPNANVPAAEKRGAKKVE